jgi:hypothetical protein
MADIELDLPDIGVVVSKPEVFQDTLDLPDVSVVVTGGEQYLANINIPSSVPIDEDNYFRVADIANTATSASYALTASYALNVQDNPAFPYTGSAQISGSLKVFGGTISGSFVGDASGLTGVSASVLTGGTATYIPIWNTDSTLSSSAIYETPSDVVITKNTTVSGSLIITDTLIADSVTGSFKGDGSQLTGLVTDLRISGSSGSDVLSLLNDTLAVLGTNGVTTVVTDNTLTINIPIGLVSSSAQITDLLPTGVVSSSAQATTWTVASASVATTASYAQNANLLDGINSTAFATTGSNTFIGTQTVSGSLLSDADTLVITGSVLVDGTMEINGVITGSIVQAISASYIDGGYY